MPSTTRFNSGEIVLIRITFTDLSGSKARPALVVSPLAYATRYSDVIVIPLTSQGQPDAALFLAEWRAAGLLKPTWIKPLLATVADEAVIRTLGRLSSSDVQSIRAAMAGMIDAQWIT